LHNCGCPPAVAAEPAERKPSLHRNHFKKFFFLQSIFRYRVAPFRRIYIIVYNVDCAP